MTDRSSLLPDIRPPQDPFTNVALGHTVALEPNAFAKRMNSSVASPAAPTCIKLGLEALNCFEVVDRQFQQWGILFTNAIALQPSNPAFPPHSGTKVLISGPRSGWIEATFTSPVYHISGYLTSSRNTVISAYDAEGNLLAQTGIAEGNLAGSNSPIAPNQYLAVQASNIYRITVYAFDGQFSLDDLQVCFQETETSSSTSK